MIRQTVPVVDGSQRKKIGENDILSEVSKVYNCGL